jgi:SAM-dependent methyltransferase
VDNKQSGEKKLMNEYIASTYGDHLAEVYDEWFGTAEEATVEQLAALAQGGRALELGIGTGRIALPLTQKGVEVHGIDASEAMISRLRARPGGEALQVTLGDFADVEVEGKYSLIFVVFNTFFALLTQENQVRCFRNVVDHLEENGVFVIEAFVPDMKRFNDGQEVRAYSVTTEQVSLQISQHDPVAQRLRSQFVVFGNNDMKLYPVEIRYCWPAEMDLMAQLAGLRLRNRWGNWTKVEFSASSQKHISVFERATTR